jgi:chemotaxis protein MotB
MRKDLNVALVACLLFTGCVTAGRYKDLEGRHHELEKEHSESLARIEEQDRSLKDLEGKLAAAMKDSGTLKSSVTDMKQALDEMRARQEEADRQLGDFRALQKSLQSMIDTGTLQVKVVKGRMVVSLGSDVLFGSGSAQLSAKGKTAIEAVTRKLAQIQKKDFQVEGHTDNVPIQSSTYPSNWELASARALNVVADMIKAGMDPARVSAASFADSRPVASNDTSDGRALNRRIEIVVLPDLSNLPGFDRLNSAGRGSTQAPAKP